jgi:hypothetical protein
LIAYTFISQPARYGATGAKVGAGSLAAQPTEGGSQLKVMEAGVNANAMKYNEIKLTADRKIIELQKRQTVLDSLNLEVRFHA